LDGGCAAFGTLGQKPRRSVAAQPSTPAPALITRESDPVNLECPFSALDGLVTPDDLFYVRSHFPVPEIDASTWRLSIGGAVERELTLSYDEIVKLPAKTVMATIECAGNNRAFLVPRVKGTQWEQGAVSNAEWTGVPLATLLRRAGVRDDAVEVILEGADRGEIRTEPKSPGAISFARSLPIEKAMRDELLIAYRMNGRDLTPNHGYPVRAVVPGWYGMASVKWLTRVIVTATPFNGYWQTLEYVRWKRENGLPSLVPLSEAQVKAQIARPAAHERIPAGTQYRVFGAAWTGESEVTRVELSSDGGKSWSEATLLDDAAPFVWRRWEYLWNVPDVRGPQSLMARATDRLGDVQPEHRDPDRRNYMINHTIPIEITVE
jgi:DMSO/TMAO reductase YedYZ molybdopterin-dependent catalytic subunit